MGPFTRALRAYFSQKCGQTPVFCLTELDKMTNSSNSSIPDCIALTVVFRLT